PDAEPTPNATASSPSTASHDQPDIRGKRRGPEVPLETVYQWRKKRTGPRGFRIGKHLRYDPADVRAYVDQRKHAETAA
ncbi:helix-turn-helix transcriptional regulator, partial [Streptomyces sp. NPDC093064]|uniref:helix-turn-helix transcriptional regulator n=1 Tax=Streptomyces sp. NPDC093064 TaxID=3366020 RepID=UPI003822CD07